MITSDLVESPLQKPFNILLEYGGISVLRHRHVVSDQQLGKVENLIEKCFSQKGTSSTASWTEHNSGDLICY